MVIALTAVAVVLAVGALLARVVYRVLRAAHGVGGTGTTNGTGTGAMNGTGIATTNGTGTGTTNGTGTGTTNGTGTGAMNGTGIATTNGTGTGTTNGTGTTTTNGTGTATTNATTTKHHATSPNRSRLDQAILTTTGRTIAFAVRHGLRVGPVVLLTVRGRTTGEPRTTPVDLLESAGRRWLVATHSAEANWVRNLRAAGAGDLTHGRRTLEFTATELPPEAAAAVLRDVLGPRLARPLGGLVLRQTMALGPRPTPDDFAAAAVRHPVFELCDPTTSCSASDARPEPWLRAGTAPRLLIGSGLLVALAHAVLGSTGRMTPAQWSTGILIGLLLAGLGNHLRIFGRRP